MSWLQCFPESKPDSVSCRLQRTEGRSSAYDDPHYHRDMVEGAGELIDVLAAMLS